MLQVDVIKELLETDNGMFSGESDVISTSYYEYRKLSAVLN
jgi:hypothetical protein